LSGKQVVSEASKRNRQNGERVLDLLDRKRQRLHVVMEGEDMFECIRCHATVPASEVALDASLPSAELCADCAQRSEASCIECRIHWAQTNPNFTYVCQECREVTA
jgi:hypothetical protein